MTQNTAKPVSRRRFLKTAGATALAASAGPTVIIPGRAQPKTLKILKHRAITATWGQWFEAFAESWGRQNDTKVVVDHVGWEDLDKHAAAEAAAQQGHDLIRLGHPPALYEAQVIDHREIFEECEHRFGKPYDFVFKDTHNPKSDKFYCFPAGYIGFLIHYRKDLWDAINRVPDSWENIRLGGRRIKFFHNHPVGIALTGYDGNRSLRAILYSFGASVQDVEGKPALKSKEALEAIKFVKALYEEAMTQDVLIWHIFSNNQAMLAEEISLTLNQISIVRTAENKQLPVADKILLASAPQGPAGRLTPWETVETFAIWNFAENIDGAKRFLVDLTGHGREEFLATGRSTFPPFPDTVPDLAQLFADDAKANPPDKYEVLATAADWSTNVGYPGYYNVAIDEIYTSELIPNMFAQAATGKMTPEEALTQADQEVRTIFQKWQDLGKV